MFTSIRDVFCLARKFRGVTISNSFTSYYVKSTKEWVVMNKGKVVLVTKSKYEKDFACYILLKN